MATEVLKTVGPSKDYTTLAAWEADLGGTTSGDLPTDDEIAIAECYSFQDTDFVAINGWTTDATRYIEVRTPSSERHSGTYNTSKYRLETGSQVMWVYEDYINLEGLQLQTTASSATKYGIRDLAGATGILNISQCIVRGVLSGSVVLRAIYCGASHTVNIWNSIVYNADNSSSVGITAVGGTINIYNNTVANCVTGIFEDGGTTTTINCTVAECTDDFSGTVNADSCASDDVEGSNHQVLSATRSDDFTDFGSDDYSIASGSVQENNGASDPGSGLFSDDIIGTARPQGASWDIGAFELVAAAAGIEILRRRIEGC